MIYTVKDECPAGGPVQRDTYRECIIIIYIQGVYRYAPHPKHHNGRVALDLSSYCPFLTILIVRNGTEVLFNWLIV